MEWKPDEKASSLYLASRQQLVNILRASEQIERDLHTVTIAASARQETQLFAMLLESVERHLRLTITQIQTLILDSPTPK